MPDIKKKEKESRYPENYSLPPVSGTRLPGNGFYQYINQEWLKKTKIPSWLSEYGASEEVELGNRKEIKRILNKYSGKEPDVGEVPSTGQDHLRFFNYIWHKSTPKSEEGYIRGLLNQILLASERPESMAFQNGWLCSTGIQTILSVLVKEEHKRPYYFRKTLCPINCTLPISFYSNRQRNINSIWLAYERYITTCSIELGIPYLLKAIEAETELAKLLSMGPNDEDIKEIRGKDLRKWVPDFCWPEFMSGLGYSEHWRQELWLIEDSTTLKRVLRWICSADSEKILAIFSLKVLNMYAEYLRPSIRTSTFNLFQKEMNGVKIPLSDELHFITDISAALPDALCSEFAKVEYSPSKLKEVEMLIDKIKDAAIDTMRHNSSLSTKTTSMVLEKIKRMKINIGSPKISEKLPEAPYYPDSLIHTHMSLSFKRTMSRLTKSGRRPDREHLLYPCFIVNASYYGETNQIMIPWGILHCPFFCDGAPLGWNYGGIGVTIGHEISHAFDIEGAEYNPKIQYKSWWTKKDRSHFKRRTRKMVKFFRKYKRFGKKLNGEKTLSENWADFGGIIIALNALKRDLDEMDASEDQRKEVMRTFFIGYTVSWRDKMRKKRVLYNIMKSVHSLPEDRVDRILPHFQEWVDAFDIKESDKLFIPVAKRLKFF